MGFHFRALFLAALTQSICGGAVGANQTVSYTLSPLFSGEQSRLSLINGQPVKLPVPVPPNGRLVFEDLVPGANWGHPGKFKVFDAGGKLLREMATRLPPAGLDEKWISGDQPFSRPPEPKFSLNDLAGKYRVANPAHYYALLINGHPNQRHWNDFSFLYRVLTTVYGYLPNQIFVADSRYKELKPDLDGDGKADITSGSSREEVQRAIETLKSTLKADDRLLVVLNDHGNVDGDESTVILFDAEIKGREFGKWIREIPAGKVLTIFEQCYSGGFVRPAVNAQHVAMSASTNVELSWATKDLAFDEFLYHVVSAFAGQTPDGRAVGADTNRDGKISAQEAFGYATAMDQRPESPLLEAADNSGAAAAVGLAF